MGQSAVMIFSSLLCYHGESEHFAGYHMFVDENFGFVLRPQGRACAYFFSCLYCVGLRSNVAGVIINWESEFFASVLWYTCCLMMLMGGTANMYLGLVRKDGMQAYAGEAYDGEEMYYSMYSQA